MQEKSFYPETDGKAAREVIREIEFSTDPADFDYMAVNVPCQVACPAYTNIPAYIRTLYEGRFDRSYELNRIVNVLPGVLGRICSKPCEDKCRHGEDELGEPVNICHIKRGASDSLEPGHVYREHLFAPLGKTVCVVGAGPAGLAAAHDLAAVGFEVEILEAFDEPGGMLLYGIPDFRLPRDILTQEIDSILRLGVSLKTGVKVGRDVSLEELLDRHDAVLIAAGCYKALELGSEGQELPGVLSGLDFVIEVNSGGRPEVGKKTLVLGAGFTAFDCARLALRLGAEEVEICIRATEADLQVTADEVIEAKHEGVKIRGLTLSNRIIGDGRVEGIECLRTRPAGVRPDGRRSVEAIPNSEFILEADTVIVAIGQGAEPLGGPGDKDERGVLSVDSESFRTSTPRLYAAGDFVTGPATVIDAIARGRAAAERLAEDLTGVRFREWAVRIEEVGITDRERAWDFIPRIAMPSVTPASQRFEPPEQEVEVGYSAEQAHEESRRCYLCYLHYEIDIDRCIYCRYCIDVAPRDCIKLVKEVQTNEAGAVTGLVETTSWQEVNAVIIDNERCIRCGECVRVCPVDCISVSKVELVERVLRSEKR
jgi:glutamate synthase (NADPH/NADH) small chain